ncbi:ABC transporter permease [Brucella thiophenivorans]|uniref:Branched-chain amino acid transport system / permease component family protein n=1 Tax=Brucella thiophenivorans TaxID=571255 RepID=A0A256F9B5_9HYPH|nr:ABC transporter permease [Brucella thiophenivorans]OYR11469.1 branched-chain amino acid transport system / permease component family protein [Brucella thiophenivorans]
MTEDPNSTSADTLPQNHGYARFDDEQVGIVGRIQRFLHSYPTTIPLIVLAISLLGFGIFAGERFFTPYNMSLIVQQVSIIGILAAAQSLVILTAGIDLSVAAIMVLSSVVAGNLAIKLGLPPALSIAAAFACGTLIGLFNGFLITRIKLPPFIATLGTWNIFYALNLYLSGAQSIRGSDIDTTAPSLKFFGQTISVFGTDISYGSVLLIIVFMVLWYALTRTSWGRHVYAVGDDREAAELAGIRTDRVLLSVYAVAGFICALAGWSAIGRLGAVSPTSFFEGNLQSITAVVIGGISLFGGRGSILGPLVGALIVGVFQSGLRIAGVDVLWQLFAIGWLILIAVSIDQWIRKVSA